MVQEQKKNRVQKQLATLVKGMVFAESTRPFEATAGESNSAQLHPHASSGSGKTIQPEKPTQVPSKL